MSSPPDPVQQEFFRELAPRYDDRLFRSRWPRNQELKAELIEELLGGTLPPRVIELGCGTGQIAEILLRRNPGSAYVGVDPSAPMLAIARDRLARFAARAEIHEVEIDAVPHEARSFDAAFGVDVLHHIDDSVGALVSLRRLLRPGASVIFLESNPFFPLTTLMALAYRAERKLLRMTRGRLARELAGAGFQRVDVRPGPIYTPPGPPWATFVLDAIDRALARAPLVRHLAIFYVASGLNPSEE